MNADKTIPVKCPSCGQELDTDADMAGEVINCPSCKNEFIAQRQRYSDAAIILLAIGLIGMVGCLFYSSLNGVIAGGFVAVIGAILWLKK